MGEQCNSKKYCAAVTAIREVENVLRVGDFKSAINYLEEAISLYTHLPNGQEMLNVCEILHKSEIFKPPQPNRETWPCDLIQLPLSSTVSEVEPRYRKLKNDLVMLKMKLEENDTLNHQDTVRIRFAVQLLRQTMSGDIQSNLVLSDDDDDDAAEEEEEEEEGYDDTFPARSPEFKKLRKNIFTALPQQPHFSPLEKYCVSARRQMRLGFDVIFVKLAQKLQNLGGNQIVTQRWQNFCDQVLSDEEEGTIREELSDLEEMGYDVIKLRERFGLLVRMKTLAKEEESYEEKRKNFEGELEAEMVQLKKVLCRIAELKGENEEVIHKHICFSWNMSCLKSELKSKGDLYSKVKMEAKDY